MLKSNNMHDMVIQGQLIKSKQNARVVSLERAKAKCEKMKMNFLKKNGMEISLYNNAYKEQE